MAIVRRLLLRLFVCAGAGVAGLAPAEPVDPTLFAGIDLGFDPSILLPGEEFFDTEEVDPTSLRRLSFSLSGLQSAVESADAAPTPDAITGFAERRKLVTEGLARWRDLLASDLPKANKSLEAAGLSPLKAE